MMRRTVLIMLDYVSDVKNMVIIMRIAQKIIVFIVKKKAISNQSVQVLKKNDKKFIIL